MPKAPAMDAAVRGAITYAEDVISGKISTCQLVKLSCQRFISDLSAGVWEFRPDLAARPMLLASLLPNIKGPEAGKPLRLMGWQQFVIANLFGFVEPGTDTRRFRQGIVFVPRGNGKGLPLETEIATPSGFVRMGDINVGDLVFDRDGNACRVSYVSPVHTGLPCYEVEFNTGERIICDEEHLWITQDTKERDNLRYRKNPRNRKPGYAGNTGKHRLGQFSASVESVKNIRDIAASITYGLPHPRHGTLQRNHRVRIAQPLSCPDAVLPIDPYILGYWLGDGTSTSANFTVGTLDEAAFVKNMTALGFPPVKRTSPSQENKAALFRLGLDGRTKEGRLNCIQSRLREIGLLGAKTLPAPYLRASEAQRWALLQGLMDSDGTASRTGQCEFGVKVLALAAGFQELVASLGFRVGPVRSRPSWLNGEVVGETHRVSFQAYSDQPVFRLERKQSQLPRRGLSHSYQQNRMITAVRPVASVPTRCIQVESESRTYLVGRTFIPTHNTSFAAPISLYASFLDGEGGAEGYAAAVTRDQARILFDTAREMVRRTPDLQRRFGVESLNNAVFQKSTASKFIPISSDAKALDGLNVQIAVCDEIGSHKTSEVYDVLLTAMGKRKHPLLLAISTATGNTTGIGKQLWDYSVRVIQGVNPDDRLFALIYTLDDGDDPWDEANWIKANPSWGQAVQPDNIRAIMRQARNNPAQEAAAKTRHLNIWVGADEALFSMRSWRDAGDPSLTIDDFEGQECEVAIDLASKTDLAAVVVTFTSRDGGAIKYTTFCRAYLNDAAVMEARNPSYPGWAANGYLTVTPGNETDFSAIESDLLDLCRRFRVISMAYDPWAATQLAQRLQAEGAPMIEFRATTQNFSEPTKELDAAMRAGRIKHDGNPVLEWCVGNVVGHYDARSNVYPRKSRPEQKIDCAVALIMSIGRALVNYGAGSVYDDRGVLVL